MPETSAATSGQTLLRLREVVKVYDTGEVPFTALNRVDLDVQVAGRGSRPEP